MNPKYKWVAGLLAALAAAAVAYLNQSCTPAQIAKVESAADNATDQALCAKAALEAHDRALVDPKLEDLPHAALLAIELRACFAKPAPAADAGS